MCKSFYEVGRDIFLEMCAIFDKGILWMNFVCMMTMVRRFSINNEMWRERFLKNYRIMVKTFLGINFNLKLLAEVEIIISFETKCSIPNFECKIWGWWAAFVWLQMHSSTNGHRYLWMSALMLRLLAEFNVNNNKNLHNSTGAEIRSIMPHQNPIYIEYGR